MGEHEADDTVISWVREFHETMAPYATGGEYIHNQTETNQRRAEAAYGANYERLVSVKNEWDPQNLFSRNQNIHPADKN